MDGVARNVWFQLAQPELGELVALLRRHSGLSQHAFAQRVALASDEDTGVVGSVIGRWENHRTEVSTRYRRLLALTCEREVARMDPLSRRRFLAGAAKIAGLGAAEPVRLAAGLVDEDRFLYSLTYPDRVDRAAIEDLVALTQLYVSQAQTIAPATLLPPVYDLMRQIRTLLAGSHPDSTRRRLQVLYGEAATVAGRIAFWKDDRGEAQSLFRLAGELAKEVDEKQLQALVLAFRADLYSGIPYLGTVPGNTNLALALFDEAAALDSSDWPPLLRSWVHGCRAEEYAALKQAGAADRDMEAAHEALAAASMPNGKGDTVVDIAVLDIAAAAAGLSGFEGAVAIALGRAREARESFEAGLKEQSSVGRLSGLAAAYALEDDVESAVDLLTQGLHEAVKRQLPTRLRRVEGVRVAFLSHAQDHPAVQRFDEEMRDAVA